MLLPEKANAIEHLSRPRARCLEAPLEVGVFLFELVHSLRIHARPTRRRVESLHPRLGLKGAAAERRQLVAEMPNQLLKLPEGFYVTTFAV